jgi:ferredoxin
MRKCTIFYFSGTGNTAWACGRLAKALNAGGLDTTLVNIEEVKPKEAPAICAGDEITGFCYPVYGSDLPQPMKTFLTGLPHLDGTVGDRKYFGMCTQEMFSGDGVRAMMPFLRASQWNVQVDYARHILMPNNISIEKYGFRIASDPVKLSRIFRAADERVASFAQSILHGEKIRQGMNLGSRFLGFIQRGPYRLIYSWLMGSFSVDHNKCNRCDICRQICPMGNISIDYEIGRNCSLCLRCYNYCPREAVLYRGSRGKGKAYQGPEGYFEKLLADKRKNQKL